MVQTPNEGVCLCYVVRYVLSRMDFPSTLRPSLFMAGPLGMTDGPDLSFMCSWRDALTLPRSQPQNCRVRMEIGPFPWSPPHSLMGGNRSRQMLLELCMGHPVQTESLNRGCGSSCLPLPGFRCLLTVSLCQGPYRPGGPSMRKSGNPT